MIVQNTSLEAVYPERYFGTQEVVCLYIPQQQLYLLLNKQKKNCVVGMCSAEHHVDGATDTQTQKI